jgi:hypothetical protein
MPWHNQVTFAARSSTKTGTWWPTTGPSDGQSCYRTNQPRPHARDTRAEVKPRLGPRVAAHLPFASCGASRPAPGRSLDVLPAHARYAWASSLPRVRGARVLVDAERGLGSSSPPARSRATSGERSPRERLLTGRTGGEAGVRWGQFGAFQYAPSQYGRTSLGR